MLRQRKYAENLTQLRELCSHFTEIGNAPEEAKVTEETRGRSRRATTV